MSARHAWLAQQLAEFLGAMEAVEQREDAGRVAAERAAEAFEGVAAAVVRGGVVEASVGFPAAAVPVAELCEVADGSRETLVVPGHGECITFATELAGIPSGRLLVARADGDPFSSDEAALARGMARALDLTQRGQAALEDERRLRGESEQRARENTVLLAKLCERQGLLERLSEIQRAIVRRTGNDEVLDAIVDGTQATLLDDLVFLKFLHEREAKMQVVASRGLSSEMLAAASDRPPGVGASGQAITGSRPVVIGDYPNDPRASPGAVALGVLAAMAAPVYRQGQIVGSLTVASRSADREYGAADEEVLLAFAELASLAITDAAMVEEATRHAFHDSLTGLANRVLFLERLEHALLRSTRSDSAAAVLFLDLDGFKTVNDSLGHGVGDALLAAVAERLLACVRPGDTVARLGGDEFAILVEDVRGARQTASLARRVLEELRVPFDIEGRQVRVSTSIGIAIGTDPAADLLRDADLAMYRAKGAGRDRFEVFAPEMHAALVERLALEADLRHAVERDELVLHYQPIVDMTTGEVAALEALVRWRHPTRGLVPPGEFIKVAEETGLIVQIGAWVLNEACRQGAAWRAEHGPITITVNLSPAQLREPHMVRDVVAALESSGYDARDLVLEITETVLMHDTKATTNKLRRLKRLGVRLAVDDFGTGYSSLEYLRGFPLDVLKVAKSFVDGLTGAAEGLALARAIVELGESFHLDVVGEGIELPEQRDRLCELGCRLGQGFLFARPAEPAAIDALLIERGTVQRVREPAEKVLRTA